MSNNMGSTGILVSFIHLKDDDTEKEIFLFTQYVCNGVCISLSSVISAVQCQDGFGRTKSN